MLYKLDMVWYQIRDDLSNKVIVFLISHCGIYATTYFALTKKTTSTEWAYFKKYCCDVYNYKES